MVDDLGDDGEFASVRSIVDENNTSDLDESLKGRGVLGLSRESALVPAITVQLEKREEAVAVPPDLYIHRRDHFALGRHIVSPNIPEPSFSAQCCPSCTMKPVRGAHTHRHVVPSLTK